MLLLSLSLSLSIALLGCKNLLGDRWNLRGTVMKKMHHSDVQISAERCFIPILSEPLIYPLTRVLILFFFSHAFMFRLYWLYLLCVNLLIWGFLHYYAAQYDCKKERNQVMLIFLCRRSKTMIRATQHFCFWAYILVSDGSLTVPGLHYICATPVLGSSMTLGLCSHPVVCITSMYFGFLFRCSSFGSLE